MEEINNVIDAEFEEVIEEPAEKNWKKHLTKQNLKKVGIAVAAMAATVLYARYTVSNIEDDAWEDGFNRGFLEGAEDINEPDNGNVVDEETNEETNE